MSEYTVEKVEADHADIAVHRDSTYEIKDGKLTWIGEGWRVSAEGNLVQEAIPQEARTWRRGNPWDGVSKVEELAPFKLRLYYGRNPGLTAGRTFQIRNGFRNCVGSFARNSKDIVWQNCAYYYMHGLGVLSSFCENLTLDHCWMAPRPGSGRTCTAWGDCFHVNNTKGKVQVISCYFHGQHDDPINIHGNFLRVIEKEGGGTKLRLRYMHNQTYGFESFYPGDEVMFIHGPSLKDLSRHKVVAAEMNGEKEMLVTLEKPLVETIGANDVLENLTWDPAVVIRDCVFEASPTYGAVLCARSRTVVENCTFRGIEMPAVFLAGYVDAVWYSSSTVHNVVLRNNRFLSCGATPIHVQRVSLDAGPVNENITIEGNFFGAFPGAAIDARNVKGLSVLNNRFASPKMPPIDTAQSVNIKIENNQPGAIQ